MKRTILISIIIVITCVLVIIPIGINLSRNMNNKNNSVNNNSNNNSEMAKKVANVVLYEGDIPDVNLEITGNYSANVTISEIKENVPVYEFDAGIVDIYGTHVNKYVGINYRDLLYYLKVPYNTTTIFKSDRKKVSYRQMEIDYDNTYIVFLMDGKPINNSKMTLLAVNYNYLYSVEGLTTIEFEG